MQMRRLERSFWMALGSGLLTAWLPAAPMQGLKAYEVRAQQPAGQAKKDQEKTPEQRAREQAESRPLLGKRPSAKAVRPAASKNVLPRWPFKTAFHYFNPVQHAEPSKEIVDLLRRLDYARALYIRSDKRGTDVHGRPYIDDNDYVELIDSLKPKLRDMQGYLLYLMRDHAKADYRRAAHFGCLFLPGIREVFAGISYAPCEPNRDIRQYAMLMGAPMLRKYLPSRGPEDKPVTVDLKSKEAKPPYTWPFDSDPYLNLLRAPTVEERLYALSFLRILAATRPDQAAEQVRRMQSFFLDGVKSSNKDIAKVTRYVINDLAIATRPITGIEDDCPEDQEKALAYFRQLMHELFPDIRIRGGLVELHEGTELRKVLADLHALCKDRKLGFRDSQEIGPKNARHIVRGLRLRDYEAIKTIGLSDGLLLTAINGTPVLEPQEIPKLIEKMLEVGQHTFAVTFVDANGTERVLQYHYKAKK